MKQRLLSLLLTGAMLLSVCPPGLALEPYAGGLCPHHQEHSFEVCGCMEAVEGQPCGHVHGGDCGFAEAVPEVPCDMGCAETGEDGQIIHAEGCAYAPEVEGAPCRHEHDGLCGYAEAAEGRPCGYVCRICPVQALMDALPDAEDITAENRAGAEAQLDAIDAVRMGLTDEEAGQLDGSRYQDVVAALSALDGQTGADIPVPAVKNVEYLYCDINGQGWETKFAGAYSVTDSSDWNTGWYVVDYGTPATIDGRITVTGDVSLILADGYSLTVNGGINVSEGNSLTIYGQLGGTGALSATSVSDNAGIGGNNRSNGGAITINGGNVTATISGGCAAGIGGGYRGAGGTITINGGVITATANPSMGDPAGIGGGGYGDAGTIVINGGQIKASGCGKGLGNGANKAGGSITINGGTVTANGIGTGGWGESAATEIKGGFVVCTEGRINKDNQASWIGVIFEDGSGQIYGNSVTLGANAEIPGGKTLTIGNGQTLTVPAGVTLTNNGTILNDGALINDGTILNHGTITGTTSGNPAEQFPSLTTGGTYWFNLSNMGIPGSVNGSLPDTALHWVPFTYAGTINAYVLNENSRGQTDASQLASETADPNGQYGYTYDHSLFVADCVVTHSVGWDDLAGYNMIFGTSYASGGVDYTLRAPSGGSHFTGSNPISNDTRGTPQSNEWDGLLSKNIDHIKNDDNKGSWMQDTSNISQPIELRAIRGRQNIFAYAFQSVTYIQNYHGFRPVLELPAPNALSPDSLKVVRLNLSGGKIGSETGPVNIVVKSGGSFIAPSGKGLTAPSGKAFGGWTDGSTAYAAGASVPASVTELTAQWTELPPAEQFPTLTPGGTYWFDLSKVGIPDFINETMPDRSLHWVPFTYGGTIKAYVLNEKSSGQTDASQLASGTTDPNGQYGYTYDHSLFVADYVVAHQLAWFDLNNRKMIFGTPYASGGVDYTLRAPSGGSGYTGTAPDSNDTRGIPQSNEWDKLLSKDIGYIKNSNRDLGSYAQDTSASDSGNRALRGRESSFSFGFVSGSITTKPYYGFRPVLELPAPGALPPDSLKVVRLNLNGGKIGSETGPVSIVVKSGGSFAAPSGEGLTAPSRKVFGGWTDGSTAYAAGASVPASVTELTAQWTEVHQVEQFPSLTPGGTYWFDLSGAGIPGKVNTGNSEGAVTIPDTTLHWVPFTYAGTINAYSRKSEGVSNDRDITPCDHSLFVADYNVTHSVTWHDLNSEGMVFGKTYTSGGVDYTMRTPSAGSSRTSFDAAERGNPKSNEWDVILDKAQQDWKDNTDGYIKNWNYMHSWGQDTRVDWSAERVIRGDGSARIWSGSNAAAQLMSIGFRPVLELPAPDTLSPGLNVVALNLNGGKIGSEAGPVSIVVKSGGSFTAPSGEGLTAPAGKMFGGWKSSNGIYQADDNVPGTVTDLTAHWVMNPSITTQPEDKTVSVGKQAAFTAAASGNPAPACKWQVSKDNGSGWEDIPGATGSSYTTEAAAMSMDGWLYRYVAVNSAGSATSNAATLTVTPPTQYTITATAGSGGSISPSQGTVTAGDSQIFTIKPDPGYEIDVVEVDGSPVSHSGSTYTFTNVQSDHTIHVIFKQTAQPPETTYTIRVTADPARGGSVTGGGTYAENASAKVTAAAKEGYHFVKWTEGGRTVSTNANYTFTVTGNRILSAKFEAASITPPDPGHTHAWATAWSKDAAHHWHECTAQGCGISDNSQKDGYALHTSGGWIVDTQPSSSTPGRRHKECTACGQITETAAIPAAGGSTGGSSGGSYTPPSTPAYPPTVERPSGGGGAATVSPSNPKPGDTVTVKPRPDDGYEVDKITVTDKDGKPVEFTKKPDGTYTFKQPTGRVKIEVSYKAVQPEAPWSNPFSDVTGGDWYYEAVRFVQERGLMDGYSDGRFGPNDTLSRAQLAQILFNKEGRPVVNYLLNFSDVADEAWYTDAVRWAASQGIVDGYGNGTFGPNDPITREQLAVMLWRYSGSPAATNKELHFNDESDISGYALEALRWAVENGILNGYGDGRLGPQGQATRAQAAQMLKNFIENQEANT